MRLPDSASVFTAEVWAIIKALEQIKISTASKYIVFTDSLSCLQALHHMKLEHPLIGMVIRKCVFLNIAKKDIVFCWVPSHTGIKGNEKADSAAKSALDLPRAKVGVPYNDFKTLYQPKYIFHLARWLEWQASPVRLAVLLQAVQEGWSSLVSCPHRSYTFDPFIYLEERSSTSVWALSVYSDSSPHFGGVQ